MKKKMLNACAGLAIGVCLVVGNMGAVYAQGNNVKSEAKMEQTSVEESEDMAYISSKSPVTLDRNKIGDLGRYDKVVFNKKKNGIYFIDYTGDDYTPNNDPYNIVYYDLTSNSYKKVYTTSMGIVQYNDDTACYFLDTKGAYDNDDFYVEISIISYDFDTGRQKKIQLESNKEISRIDKFAVDKKGRIYIPTEEKIFLYSADGRLLSSVKQVKKGQLISFCGFDSTNGNFYYIGHNSWINWGYNHDMPALMAGNVDKNNKIHIHGENMQMLYQDGFYEHNEPVTMLNDRYLASLSTLISETCTILDSNNYDYTDTVPQDTTIEIIDNKTKGTLLNIKDDRVYRFHFKTAESKFEEYAEEEIYKRYNNWDRTSIGTRCAITSDGTSVIAKTGEKLLTEYSLGSKKEVIRRRIQHPAYTLGMIGNRCVVVEKDNDKFYVEAFEWTYPEDINVSAPSAMRAGQSGKVRCKAPDEYELDYTYSSSDPKTVSVDYNGNLSAWKKGTVKITVVAKPINKKKTITIKVADSRLSKSKLSYKTSATVGTTSSTIHKENSSGVYGRTKTAYLTALTNGNLERVEYVKGRVIVETYNSAYKLTGVRRIRCELPIWGGFYSGKKYNFIVFGQENKKESDKKEVIRVVKYSKNWKRLGSCAIKGANTTVPFEAGEVAMTEAAGKLYVHTCHEMYKAADMWNHQANCTFVVKQSNMKLVDSYYDVMNLSTGYVGHSFSQAIATDGKTIYRADMGEAIPCGLVVTNTPVSGKVGEPSGYVIMYKKVSNKFDNTYGHTLGDMKLGRDNIVATGVGIRKEGTFIRQVYVTTGNKNMGESKVTWLTNYKESENITPQGTKLVKLGSSQFLVMWEEFREEKRTYRTRMVLIDEAGNIASSIYSTTMALSECDPIVTKSGKVVWYVTNGSSPIFVEINPYRLSSAQNKSKKDITFRRYDGESYDESSVKGYTTGDTVIVGKKVYKFTSSKTVAFCGFTGKVGKSITISGKVNIRGKMYKVTSIYSRALINQPQLKKIVIGAEVSSVGSYAFYNCRALTSVTFGKNTKVIGTAAFANCRTLRKIVIPAKVSGIRAKAFKGCSRLGTISILSAKLTAKNVGKQAFEGIRKKAVVYVPASKKAAYSRLLKSRGVPAGMTVKKKK